MSDFENSNQNIEAEKKPKQVVSGESYPIQSIKDALSDADKVIAREGTSKPISKDKISEILGKKIATLGLTFSTWNQYNILTTVRGEGYKATSLYNKYIDKTYTNDEHDAQLEMFKTPELYAKIISNLDGHVLPSEDKFGNILVQHPYNINPNSAVKAAKVFYENSRDLGLLDRNNKFKFSDHSNGHVKKEEPVHNFDHGHTPPPPPPVKPDDGLFELPIPLSNRKTAYLKYPRETLTTKDISVIRKALDFIESSVSNDDDLG